MIQIDINKHTYVCPFCGHDQAYWNSYHMVSSISTVNIPDRLREVVFDIYTLTCSNTDCGRVTVTAINKLNTLQVDLIPKVVIKEYPDYIPEQIRNDYREAHIILNDSPKAAATLLRRCLQGMIHDFWGIHEKNLNAEISALKDKVSPSQWAAIDGLRTIGNIGAHMEKDVNVIIDVEPEETIKLLKLIELLIEKWYVARHDEEELFKGITDMSKKKEIQRKTNDATN